MNDTQLEDASSTSNDAAKENSTHVPVILPTLEVQYVCAEDIRPGFNTTRVFEDLYQSLLPDMAEPHLTTMERISGMDNLLKSWGKKKLYTWHCNTTSKEILMTFKVKAFAYFERSSPNIAEMDAVITPTTIQEYFETNVCTRNQTKQFQAFVENPFRKEFQSNDFDQVRHQVQVLCPYGYVSSVYVDYDDDPNGDPIFVLFGIFVGYYMVRMILVELQNYGRRGGGGQYEELSTSYEEEGVEMM